MLNGNGNKSSKEINTLCCFFLSKSPSGHAGSKCDIWHWFTCKGRMYARASYTLTYRLQFFLTHSAPLHALCAHESCTFLTITAKKLPLILILWRRAKSGVHWGNPLTNRLWYVLKMFSQFNSYTGWDACPQPKRDIYTCISKTNLFGSWHFTTCSSTSCPSNLW